MTGSQVAVPGDDTIQAGDGGVLVRPVRIRKVPAYLRDYVREWGIRRLSELVTLLVLVRPARIREVTVYLSD